ncbi:Rieske (2Fe-2S) protein [Streptomyces sp. NPDC004596]|uniref:Rieske (2Fe-2S) protein n=1 Tax=Streptomyces sp. DSM 118148 TaxID=3448667 RepID=UPI00403FE625
MTSASFKPEAGPARRTVMAAAGAAGLAAALTACGSGDASSDAVDTGSGTAGTTGSTQGGASPKTGQAAGGSALARTSDIPEGGGKIFKDQGVVVTQPTAGAYKAFSAKCTHQGCAVSRISDGVIVCPCHNSHFSVADGSVKQGPATEPLAAEKITVSGDEIKLA